MSLLAQLAQLNETQLRRLLVEHLTKQKLGLTWEASAIERDAALNADLVLPKPVPTLCSPLPPAGEGPGERAMAYKNLIIEGDNFDALRLLKATHAGKIRVIYIDPPYNTGNKDWVYNDHYVGANDRWRHSQWLEFLYRRLTLARDLLTPDGVIMVSINDENRSRLELLMDEVMPGRRLGSITWRTRQGSNDTKGGFLSVDHEHVLVYGNPAFSFNGFTKSYEMYGNRDNDPRGDWRSSDLTKAHDYKERPNTFYPIRDPKTEIHYPANPDAVWRYSSRERLKEGQKLETKTMEEFIELGQILFPKEQHVAVWKTIDELRNAIDTGQVPKSGKSPMLRHDLPDLEYWVGKQVGFGRPAFKRYKADLRNDTQPLSSWIVPKFEEDEYEAENSFTSGTNQEGARDVVALFGDKAFNYAKPLSLIKNLLQQATRPGDIVLDFFAGSGTTGHAVLELNAEDQGQRSFILCSSTEATKKEPDKNLCRDVCAERIKRVIQGYHGRPGIPGNFAYLQLDKVEPADAPFEANAEHAFHLLALQRFGNIRPLPPGPVKYLGQSGDCAVLVCAHVDPETITALANWPQHQGVARLAIYSPRPTTLAEQLAARGIEANCYSLLDAILRGQTNSPDSIPREKANP
jgi:adenine-specific DNA-methyltransferase